MVILALSHNQQLQLLSINPVKKWEQKLFSFSVKEGDNNALLAADRHQLNPGKLYY